jgi:hypothetical protein
MLYRTAGWSAAACAIVACGLAGCGEDRKPLHVVDLADGAYLRGVQVSALEVDELGERQAVRAELFLDGARVAADDFAPFELAWDTRAFDDGAHQLLARIYLDNGNVVDAPLAISIDNTPPVIGPVPAIASTGDAFGLVSDDNLGIERIELSRGLDGEAPAVIMPPNLSLPWPFPCGAIMLHIRVIDHAGGEATGTFPVTSANAKDLDCDGFVSRAAGGNDCNDRNASYHPGAAEVPEGFDLNCDGVVASLDGFDSDHDGVPSISDGGNDCNDSDPSIHGAFFAFGQTTIFVDGTPLHWNPGEAALSQRDNNWEILLNRGGVVDQVTLPLTSGASATATLTRIASTANPGSITVQGDYLAYGQGNQVVVLKRSGAAWINDSTIAADAPVGKLALSVAFDGSARYAAYQAGTKIWFASTSSTTWTTKLAVDAQAPLVEAPTLSASGDFADITLRTATKALELLRSGPQASFNTQPIGPPEASASALSHTPGQVLVAVDHGAGSTIYRNFFADPLYESPQRIIGIFFEFPYVFVQREDLRIDVLLPMDNETSMRKTQTITGIGRLDAEVPFSLNFAGDGVVSFLSGATVFQVFDGNHDDGIDTDCDGVN